MTTYTPGPWEAHGIRPTEIGPDGLLTIHHDQPFDRWMVSRRYRDEQGRRCTQFVAEVVCSAPHPDEQEPNAQLIAASPGLLEALKELLEAVIWMSGSADFAPEGQAHKGWVKVRPVINKAQEAIEHASR